MSLNKSKWIKIQTNKNCLKYAYLYLDKRHLFFTTFLQS
jgi:hypothetical protein